jgi:uncharacterized repeat protein (TIGR01451 family)
VVRNTGVPFYDTVRVTDTLPAGLSYLAGSLTASSGSIDASAAPTLKWSGTMSTTPTSIVTITYRALVTAAPNQIITNTAAIDPALNQPFTRSAVITIAPGSPDLSASTKQASTAAPRTGEVVTYTIVLRNSGTPLTATARVTDNVPTGLIYVSGSFTATSGTVDQTAAPVLKWSGAVSSSPPVTLTYAVTVAASLTITVTNVATIDPVNTAPFTRSATVIVNAHKVNLPLILRSD